ncbi:MAG: DNA polymerase III subunit beta [Patescibacteria group bacterium]
MKLTVLQENLAEALSTVTRVVSSTGSLPVLSNVLLEASEGRLKLAATDLETGVVSWVGAQVEEEGSITVPAKVFSRLVSNLSPGEISLELEKQILKLTAEDVESEFNGLSADEFPNLPELEEENAFELSGDILSAGLDQVIFAAATDEGRPVLTGVLFCGSGDELTLVGVDGFRLAEKKLDLEQEIPDLDVIVPARTLRELALLIGKIEEPVKVSQAEEDNQLVFQVEDVCFSSRLLEGEFPDYQEIIPDEYATRFVFSREEFLNSVSLSSIFSQVAANIVRLELSPDEDQTKILANTQEIGSSTVDLAGDGEGEEVKIAFNAKYLSDCLSALSCEEVSFEAAGSLKPAIIRPLDSDDYLHVVMPVRVQE